MPIHPMARRRNRRSSASLAVVTAVVLLGACTSASSPPTSDKPVTGSTSEQPSAVSTTAGSSLAATSAPPALVTTVTIRNRSFGAPEITVAVGKVTFINADTLPHTVTEGQDGVAAPNARINKVVGVGESIEVTFPDPGDYQITCLFHSEMHLLVHAH